MPPTVDCYGLRRLNPFLGVAAVARTPRARAVSVDGVTWQIQVLAAKPRGLWDKGRSRHPAFRGTAPSVGGGELGETAYFRFGIWSQAEGTQRVPLNPLLGIGAMLDAADELTALLPDCQTRLPFPLRDALELWLLDGADGAPLALLATALAAEEAAGIPVEGWTAGGRGETPFAAPSLVRRGIPVRDGTGLCHVEAVEALVRRAAGRILNARWIQRDLSGAGRALDQGAGPSLGPNAFPELLLREPWPDPSDAELVREYLDWMAPFLLTLPGIGDAARERLERLALRRALVVDRLWRLYPRVIQPDRLNQARVEARIRRSST